MNKKILIICRGGGDLATGIVYRLFRAGFPVLVLETDSPAAIRRQVSFSEAVYDGTATVEGVTAERIASADRASVNHVLEEGRVPLLVDPEGSSIPLLKPDIVVDAIIAKKNLGTAKEMAPLVIGVGPGFTAGEDVDLVVESTGTIKKRAGLAEHMACGAKKVIMSAPVSDADITIVMGVNDGLYDPAKHDVVSSASCTTNCLAPVAKVLNDTFGIEHGLMTTIHSYTMSQRILDGSQKDIRRARAAAMSMIPTTTGAAKAVALVLPELKGKLDGIAIRVPTPNVSIVDLNCVMKRDVTVDEVNAALTAAANDNFGVSDEPLVSIDYNGDTHGGVVDLLSTSVMSGNMLKVLIWYDNEAGFTNQLLRLITMVGGKM